MICPPPAPSCSPLSSLHLISDSTTSPSSASTVSSEGLRLDILCVKLRNKVSEDNVSELPGNEGCLRQSKTLVERNGAKTKAREHWDSDSRSIHLLRGKDGWPVYLRLISDLHPCLSNPTIAAWLYAFARFIVKRWMHDLCERNGKESLVYGVHKVCNSSLNTEGGTTQHSFQKHGSTNSVSAISSLALKLERAGLLGSSLKEHCSSCMEPPSTTSGSSKWARAPSAGGSQMTSCLVDGCNADLRTISDAIKFVRFTPRVPRLQSGVSHSASISSAAGEFDEGKRSCRKRLEGHNH
ncbi:hypothetical protein AKJ16_DCAP02003 [Drosera capensis]